MVNRRFRQIFPNVSIDIYYDKHTHLVHTKPLIESKFKLLKGISNWQKYFEPPTNWTVPRAQVNIYDYTNFTLGLLVFSTHQTESNVNNCAITIHRIAANPVGLRKMRVVVENTKNIIEQIYEGKAKCCNECIDIIIKCGTLSLHNMKET